MKRLIIIPVLAALAGCGTLARDNMGKTAGCLHDAETVRRVHEHMDESPPVYPGNPAETKRRYQSAKNDCWWAKGDSKN